MQKARLLPESGKVVVALSGGRDSMALLHVVCVLKKQGLLKSVRAFHVNHGTRPENGEEEELVKKFCQKSGVSALVFHPFIDLTRGEAFVLVERFGIVLHRLCY